MRTRNYNHMINEFSNWADTMNRVLSGVTAPYDYAGNGGSQTTAPTAANGQSTPSNGQHSRPSMRLPVDIWQQGDNFYVNAYLPGVDPEAVQITWENDELLIEGQLSAPTIEGEWLRRELFHGHFERRVGFTVPVDADKIQADFHNGLLTLTIPKAETVRPKQIKVQAR